jgi:hypothetical protein
MYCVAIRWAENSVALHSLLVGRADALARGVVRETSMQAFARFAKRLNDRVAGRASLADRGCLRRSCRLRGRGLHRLYRLRGGGHWSAARRRRFFGTAASGVLLGLLRGHFALFAQRLDAGFARGAQFFSLVLS